MTCRFSSVRSRTDPHAPHPIDSVCSNPRTVSGAPQLGHVSVRILGASRGTGAGPAEDADPGGGSPSIGPPQPRECQLVELDELAEKDERRILAVVERGEGSATTLQVGDRRLVARADAK